MRNVLRKSSLIVVLLLLCALIFVAVLSSNTTIASAEEQARRVNLAVKETPMESFDYSPMEGINYIESKSCRILQPETEKFAGIIGNNAIKKTPSDTNNGLYQLYFDKCLENGNIYEMSFWVKTVNEDAGFQILVYHLGKENTTKVSCDAIKDTNGEWKKYSVLIEAKKVHTELFRFTLEAKGNYQEIYYDQMSLRLVEEQNALILGADFNDDDWASLPEMTPSSFVDGGINVARMIKSGTLSTNMLAVPQDGVFRLNLAVKRTSDASVTMQVRDEVGGLIDERLLTSSSLSSMFDIATGDLSAYKFVTINLVVESADDGYVQLGLIELIEHSHDFFGQKESLLSDCQSQKTCNTCNLDVVMGEHTYVVTNPNCSKDGKKECSICKDTIVIAKTGQHRYPTCSSDNDTSKRKACLDCGKAMKYPQKEHTLVYERVSDTEHREYCSFCGYEELCEHEMSAPEMLSAPTFDENGYAITACSICEGKALMEVPKVDEQGSALWTKTIVSEPSCEGFGEIRYDYANAPISVFSYVEPHGHEYVAIKKDATCTEDGISLHHKCTICNQTKESENEIRVIEATGHVLGDWVQTKDPTLLDDGFRYRNCSTCGERLEEEAIPRLNDKDYTKYALEDHDTENGYYEYYSSDIYGVYSVWVEGTHINQKIITIVISCFATILVVAIAIYITFVILRKKKVGAKK